MFPFVIPWDDSTPGTANDVSALNVKPAGADGYIVAKNGHFYESKTDTRVRFLGVSFAAHAAFPPHADADKVAARIAKLGINIVRLHHMDNDNWAANAHIWDPAYKDHQHIDAGQLDKLDYLIGQFKKNGVYVNINLHVSRQFTPDDGFPASVNNIPTSYDKRVDEFDPRMIQLQKNYARDLLTHVNQYTHLSYADDPCVAVVEINNENSLVGEPWGPLGADLDTLPEPFRGELVGLWNKWLAKKYGSDAKIQAAWLKGVTPNGPNMLTPRSPWSVEHSGTSQASIDSSVVPPTGAPPAGPSVQATVSKIDDTNWHVQVHQVGLDFKNGETYTVSFQAKADAPRPMPLAASLDEDDWHNIGLNATANLTTDWKTFRYTFDAHDAAANHGRVAFTLGGQTGTVWIANLQVMPGAEGAGIQAGQSLAKRDIDMPTIATKNERADWIEFLADTERAYADEMRDYLKDTLHVHANIVCTQISFGGLTGISRDASTDFADNHAYWEHPSFPHKPWDSKDWNIPNKSMVADMASGGGGALSGLAEYRIAGKPYSVSEYNEPAPNDFQAETVPVLASFAAFQDWDMIYLFDYGDYGTGTDNEKINGYFSINSNPAKMAFMPAAAMIFRGFQGATSPNLTEIGVTKPQSLSADRANSVWTANNIQPGTAMFKTRLALAPPGVSAAKSKESVDAPILKLVTTPLGAYYEAVGPKSVTLAGILGGQTISAGPLSISPALSVPFSVLTLTQMPNKSQLLTMVGKVENQGMVWNATRTSVTNEWGHGPSVAEGIPAQITLKTGDDRHVYALDGTGKRITDVPAAYKDGALTFAVGPEFKTLWYEIAP